MKPTPPSSSSRTAAACDVAAASESVAVKQSTHRGEAVQATAKSPSMKLQPPPSIVTEEQPSYLWSPETAAGAATFLGLFIVSCFVVRRCQSYHFTTAAFALSR
ncbi:uncharacterized protein [Arachis hypogaea]|uniref:uncharacterized protein n=1 Tax=Arachis hypogaea TaxID=3818 RepID=UPI003B2233EE|nr:uncharacterized protein DS421_18g632920 [Arachis hypogaea]